MKANLMALPSCNRVCSCGKLHTHVPFGARLQMDGDSLDGYYWECECKSTLFLPLDYFWRPKMGWFGLLAWVAAVIYCFWFWFTVTSLYIPMSR